MSGEEKATQIGVAASEFQEAKTELGHIDTKVEKVFSTYRQVGETMDRGRGTIEIPKIVEGKLVLGYHRILDYSGLLNLADLTALVQERQTAENRVKAAEKQLRDLGFTAFEPYSSYSRR